MRNNNQKRWFRRLTVCILAVMLIITGGCAGTDSASDKPADQAQIENVKQETVQALLAEPEEYGLGEYGSEWLIFGLNASGSTEEGITSVTDTWADTIRALVKAKKGKLDEREYAPYARVSQGLVIAGRDPKDVEGYNLIKPLDEYEGVKSQGIHAEIHALIAAHMAGVKLTHEKDYVADLLAECREDGSIRYEGTDMSKAEIDITAMAIQALAPFAGERADCKEAVDAALTYLGSEQKEDGSYGNAESTAQVILAVNMAGRDPLNDPEFVKGDCNLGNGLLIFRKGDAFAHTTEDEVTAMATEQALLAMDAITLAGEGKTIYSAE